MESRRTLGQSARLECHLQTLPESKETTENVSQKAGSCNPLKAIGPALLVNGISHADLKNKIVNDLHGVRRD